MDALIGPDEGPVVDVREGEGPFAVVSEHATSRLPRAAIEICNDLLRATEDVAAWMERLSDALPDGAALIAPVRAAARRRSIRPAGRGARFSDG